LPSETTQTDTNARVDQERSLRFIMVKRLPCRDAVNIGVKGAGGESCWFRVLPVHPE